MDPVYDIPPRIHDSADDPDDALRSDIVEIKATLAILTATPHGITAPVRTPQPEDMEVTLVPSTILDRLDEYRGDESLWLVLFGLFTGAIVGVFVNVATGGRFDVAVLIILVVFVIMACATGGAAWRARTRGNAVKRALLRGR